MQRATKAGRNAAALGGGWLRIYLPQSWRLWPLLVVALLVGIVWSQFRHSDTFRLTEIRISSCKQVADAELRRYLHMRVGQNVFSIDLEQEAERVVSHPWVRGAVVTRELPNRVVIDVVERRPVALLKVNHLYLVDDTGRVFKRLENGDPSDLPIVTGFSAEAFHAGGATAARQARRIRDAVKLIATAQESGALGADDISEVRYDLVSGFSLITNDVGLTIRFGFGDYETKLQAFRAVAQRLKASLAKARVVDLAVPGRVVVRGLPEESGA